MRSLILGAEESSKLPADLAAILDEIANKFKARRPQQIALLWHLISLLLSNKWQGRDWRFAIVWHTCLAAREFGARQDDKARAWELGLVAALAGQAPNPPAEVDAASFEAGFSEGKGQVLRVLSNEWTKQKELAARLRVTLDDYFQTIDPNSQIVIRIPPGQWRPEVTSRIQADEEAGVSLPEFSPNAFHISKLPTVNPSLIGRDDMLDQLDRAWNDAATGIFSIFAFGGVGKTALAINWWHNRGARGARRVLGWSSYSQGAREGSYASADLFLHFALTEWFNVVDPPNDSWHRGELLARFIRKEPTLLILDGLEPLQRAPGPQGGEFRDRGMVALLKELAASNSGLCVCTSRLPLTDLIDYRDHGVREVELENLTPANGAQYLATLGVRGEPAELLQASVDFGNHALALTLLGSLIKRWGGDVRRRDMIPSLFDARQGGHARRIMREYENMFHGKPDLEVLHLLGLFDRPADPGALKALSRLPYAQWVEALENLRDARLVDYGDPQGTVDCHPLIREHFADSFRAIDPVGFSRSHSRLYEYYSKLAPHRPTTTPAMTPLFYAISHGCQASRHQEAWDDVYVERLLHGEAEYYLTQKLGEVGLSLSLLANFFNPPWTGVVTGLEVKTFLWILGEAGFTLHKLRRLDDATQPMQAALNGYAELNDWENASICANNLSELRLTLGTIERAISTAEHAVECADRSGITLCRMGCRATLANALHQAGLFDEARRQFEAAEQVQAASAPDRPFLYGQPLFQYCDLLLHCDRRDEVVMRIRRSMPFSTRLYFEALDHLALGRASTPGSIEAAEHLDFAVDGLRRAEHLDQMPLGLLARATHSRELGQFERAERDLAAVWDVANRPGMLLHLADYYLEHARLSLLQGKPAEAHVHYQNAADSVQLTGYRRRSVALAEIERLFA